jgi:hypothetical protein
MHPVRVSCERAVDYHSSYCILRQARRESIVGGATTPARYFHWGNFFFLTFVIPLSMLIVVYCCHSEVLSIALLLLGANATGFRERASATADASFDAPTAFVRLTSRVGTLLRR